MTPTNWQGITALCAILAVILTIVGGVWALGNSGGKVTNALEGLRSDFKEFREDFKKSNEKTDAEFDKLKQRTSHLENILDVDGSISKVLELRRRRADA